MADNLHLSFSTATFAEIVGAPSEDVSIQSVTDWDPRNEYKAVVEAVVKASGVDGAGELKVYRVQEAGSRALYYILGAAKDDRKLKGVRVKAVES